MKADPDVAAWVELELMALERMRKGRYRKPELTEFHRLALTVLQRGMGTGIHNVQANWERAEFHPRFLRVVIRCHGWATFDFSELTRLVIAAHDACVRVQIEPRARDYLAVFLSPRDRDATGMASRHPTIEQAVEDFRGGRKVVVAAIPEPSQPTQPAAEEPCSVSM